MIPRTADCIRNHLLKSTMRRIGHHVKRTCPSVVLSANCILIKFYQTDSVLNLARITGVTYMYRIVSPDCREGLKLFGERKQRAYHT